MKNAAAKAVTPERLMEAVTRVYGPLAKAAAINEAFFPGRGDGRGVLRPEARYHRPNARPGPPAKVFFGCFFLDMVDTKCYHYDSLVDQSKEPPGWHRFSFAT